jgi:predicted aminopeptidase
LAALFSNCPLAERAYYCLPDLPSQHPMKETSTSITSSNRVGDLSSQDRSLTAQDNAFDEAYVTRVSRDLYQAWDYWKSTSPTRSRVAETEEEREMEYLSGVKRWNDCARVVCLSDLQSERHILGPHEFIFEPLR